MLVSEKSCSSTGNRDSPCAVSQQQLEGHCAEAKSAQFHSGEKNGIAYRLQQLRRQNLFLRVGLPGVIKVIVPPRWWLSEIPQKKGTLPYTPWFAKLVEPSVNGFWGHSFEPSNSRTLPFGTCQEENGPSTRHVFLSSSMSVGGY